VGAVPVVIHRVVIVVHEISAARVIQREIRMCVVDASIDNGNCHARAFDPRLVNESGANALDTPAARQLHIEREDHGVRLDESHARILAQSVHRLCRKVCGHARNEPICVRDVAAHAAHQCFLRRSGLGVKRDQHVSAISRLRCDPVVAKRS
jgi:hypothetical protein